MNVTILSLTLSALFSHSPVFVNRMDRIAVDSSRFSKFTSTLFYNLKSLNLRNTEISNGLSSILEFFDEGNILLEDIKRTDIANQVFSNRASSIIDIRTQNNNPEVITITFCTIKDSTTTSDAFIYISKTPVSMVISDTTFYNLKAELSIVYSNPVGSLSISHVCASNYRKSGTTTGGAFLNLQSKTGNHVTFLYSTIFFGEKNNNQIKGGSIYFQSADQRIRCINMTNHNGSGGDKGIEFSAPECLSIAMVNVINYNQATILDISTNNNKLYFERINFVGNKGESYLISIKGETSGLSVTFDRIYFKNNLNGGDATPKIRTEGSPNVVIKNSIFDADYVYEGVVTFTNNSKITDNSVPMDIFYFYVDGDYCQGAVIEKAYGCAVGDCPPNAGCADKPLTFPTGVPAFTTYPHFDLQTSFFTPTQNFTYSKEFTISTDFSQSNNFEPSSGFSMSEEFRKTEEFSKSFGFTESTDFTESTYFTKSTYFTESSDFTVSYNFEKTPFFSSSFDFTHSTGFSETKGFSKTTEFTYSTDFAESDGFTISSDFTRSETHKIYTDSFGFTQSEEFSRSTQFTKSDYFKPTFDFSASSHFTLSTGFTLSTVFLNSDPFSNSNDFLQSSDFTQSNNFLPSDTFKPSNMFTPSHQFTESHTFSPSNKRIDIDQGKDEKKFNWLAVGLGVGAFVVVAIIAIALLLCLRKSHVNESQESMNEVETQSIDTDKNILDINNPLEKMNMKEDDPFQEDFVEDLPDGNTGYVL